MLKLKIFNEMDFIERIKTNDRAVLGEIFLRYRKMVFSHILSHGGSKADAEDMLQEAIIVLWQNVCSGKFELRSKLGTYIMAVAKNKWMAEQRKRSRYTSDGNLSLAEKEDEAPSSLDSLLADEQQEAVQAALQKIGDNCRKLLMLFYFEERSMAEIAGIMKFAGPDVAKAKKYQCKKSLEAVLKARMTEQERGI